MKSPKTKILQKLIVYGLHLIAYSLLLTAFISTPVMAGTTNLTNPLSTNDLPTLAGTIIKALLGITGSVALLIFIYGGFLWLTSAGNSERIKKGKDTLIWAAIGLIFIFSSYIIANFIIQALGGNL